MTVELNHVSDIVRTSKFYPEAISFHFVEMLSTLEALRIKVCHFKLLGLDLYYLHVSDAGNFVICTRAQLFMTWPRFAFLGRSSLVLEKTAIVLLFSSGSGIGWTSPLSVMQQFQNIKRCIEIAVIRNAILKAFLSYFYSHKYAILKTKHWVSGDATNQVRCLNS